MPINTIIYIYITSFVFLLSKPHIYKANTTSSMLLLDQNFIIICEPTSSGAGGNQTENKRHETRVSIEIRLLYLQNTE